MNWIPKNKAESLFKNYFQSKSEMAKQMNISRMTLDKYLNDAEKMNSQIKKLSKLTGRSQMTLFKMINF